MSSILLPPNLHLHLQQKTPVLGSSCLPKRAPQILYYFLPLYSFPLCPALINVKCGLGSSTTSSEKLPPSQTISHWVCCITSLDAFCLGPHITSVLSVMTSFSTRLHYLFFRCCPSPCCLNYPSSSFTPSWLLLWHSQLCKSKFPSLVLVFNTLNNSLRIREDREQKLAQEKYVCSKNITKFSLNSSGESTQSFFSSGKTHQYFLNTV